MIIYFIYICVCVCVCVTLCVGDIKSLTVVTYLLWYISYIIDIITLIGIGNGSISCDLYLRNLYVGGTIL